MKLPKTGTKDEKGSTKIRVQGDTYLQSESWNEKAGKLGCVSQGTQLFSTLLVSVSDCESTMGIDLGATDEF